MGRKRKPNGLMDAVAVMPWQGGVALAVIGFLLIRYRLAGWLLNTGGMLAPAFSPMLKLLAWFWLAVCLFGALASFITARKKRSLLDTRTDLESLSATGWRNFEQLVGEAFRRQGYSIDENHQPGPDGGIDLILHKDGRRTLVQCKQWKRQQVGVAIVREMYGLLVHHNANAVKVVSTGTFTRDAETFAAGKPIELVSGEELLRMVRATQAPSPAATTAPTSPVERVEPTFNKAAGSAAPCPRCGAELVERRNRRTGKAFKGCSRFPVCRGVG
jgi:restriction system protein